MMPKPIVATGAGAAGATGFDAAEAAPGPVSAASAAISAMIAAPRLIEVFLAISLSLSLSACAHEPQSLGGLCEVVATDASPERGSRRRNSLVRVISETQGTSSKRGHPSFVRKKDGCLASQLEQHLPWSSPGSRPQVAGASSYQGSLRPSSSASRRFGSAKSCSSRVRTPEPI